MKPNPHIPPFARSAEAVPQSQLPRWRGFAIRATTVIHLLLLSLQAQAQQQPTYFHTIINPYLINSAYAGESQIQNIALLGRSEFLNMPDAPKFYHLTFDAALANPRIGLGASAFSNTAFAVKNIGFSASYRYKFQIAERHFLSTALSAGLVQNSLDFSKIIANDPSEISDFMGSVSGMQPNISIGLLYQFAQLKIGASAMQLLAPAFTYEKSMNQQSLSYRLLQQYYLSAAYTFRLSSRWATDVMLLGGSAHGLPLWGRAGAVFNYDDMFWFGGGFGYESTSYLLAGVRLAEQLVCSYSYGFSTAGSKDYRSYLGATHEIALGYRIQRAAPRGRDQRLAQEVLQLQYIVESQGEEIDRLKQERLELRRDMSRLLLDRETIDSLIQLSTTLALTIANQQTEEPEPEKDTIFEDCFYVVIGATRTVADVKEFQKIILRDLGIDTKVLDPDASRSFFFVYTHVFTDIRDAQRAIRDLGRTNIGEYIIGAPWVYQSTRPIIE